MENRDRDKISRESSSSTPAGDVNRHTSSKSGQKNDSSVDFGQKIGRSEMGNEGSRRSGVTGSDSGMQGDRGRSSGSTDIGSGSNRSGRSGSNEFGDVERGDLDKSNRGRGDSSESL